MSLKKLEISRLMDAYTDEEFVPEESPIVSRETIKETVFRTAREKSGKTRKVFIIAAALAACLALVGWTKGEEIYRFFCGGQIVLGENSVSVGTSDGYSSAGEPLVVSIENDRVWFVADGQRIDITDRIDEQTPYIYTAEDEQGNRSVLVVGGTSKSCGWMERWESANGDRGAAEVYDGTVVTGEEDKEPAWLVNAREQLRLQHG